MQLTELNRKLFKVKIELRKVVIIFVETNLLGCLSSAPSIAFIPSLFDMLVHKDFTSNGTSTLSSGISSIWLIF